MSDNELLVDFLGVPSEQSSEPRSTSENLSSGAENIPVRVRRRPIPRKGHTKSRNGCYNCKRRKVKCQENLPECYHCKRIGLLCEYPQAKTAASQLPSPSNALQSTPTSFSLDDLRFFQHFILAAYPPLPIGGDEIWRDVTRMSHSYDFLIHAMLGLGASHLTLCVPGNYSSQALDHRVQAIKSLNTMLSKPNLSQVDGDAAFATIMALTFQSSYMPEGMFDFVSMVRGCHIVATKAMPSFEDSAFRSFSREGHVDSFQKLVEEGGRALKNWGIVDGYLVSIRALAPLCRSTVELNYLAEVQKVIQMAMEGDNETYGKFACLYNRFGEMTNEDFVIFCDPKNFTSQLLLSHFFLMDYIIGETGYNDSQPSIAYRKKITLLWLERTAKNLPQKYQRYIQWPLNFARNVIHGTEPHIIWDSPGQGSESSTEMDTEMDYRVDDMDYYPPVDPALLVGMETNGIPTITVPLQAHLW